MAARKQWAPTQLLCSWALVQVPQYASGATHLHLLCVVSAHTSLPNISSAFCLPINQRSLLQGVVSGFPGSLCFASSPRLYLFSRHSCPCHRPLKLGPLPEGDALLSWSQGCLAPHSLADSLLWDAESCHLPGRSLRKRETRLNPSLSH